MNSFTCFSLSPIGLAHPGIAVATTRAGGVGLLDREFCLCGDMDLAIRNLDQLLKLVNDTNAVGLRLRVDQITSSTTLLQRLCDRPHWLILCGWDLELIEEFEQVIASMPHSHSRRLLIEVTDIDQVLALDHQSFDGLVARGHESGGWVGEDSAFILTQKILGIQPLPVYVQGGIGIHTVAACRAAGAAGVILDDQLLLMPESPLPGEWQRYIGNLNGTEAIAIGERLNASCRVLSRPGFQVINSLQQLADATEVDYEASSEGTQHWRQQARSLIGWGASGILAWPIGQAVGLAARYCSRYKTTGKLVQALLKASVEHIETAKALRPLQANAPMAAAHSTRYPIVQGPMTRVSDTAEFADAVASAGALPMLALALMQGAQVRALLQKAKELMGDRSWGVGLLGFIPQALREDQMQAVKEFKPPFALIAGGRPNQAAQFEDLGIATYIHVPTPGLLKMFLEQGARRFIFEGRECGGHVGPLSSFMLWESMIETLINEVPESERDVHVLFAGGIHDARSAAMVSAMAAPLVERGMRVGVLMGTAYLFTEEAISCGAIVRGYQEQALACTRTINLETGPGHASRCARTQFASEFYATRRRMIAAGSSAEEIKNALEDLNLGRLRIASKGLFRGAGNQITTVDQENQLNDGMYMLGQVATMRNKVCSVQTLHQDVSETSTHLLATLPLTSVAAPDTNPASPSDIAIIGIGTLLPKAAYPETFWENILASVNTITEIPPHRWDWRLYYDPDRNAQDKVYSKWGGFLDDVPFEPIRFGIPPKSLKSIEPLQLLTLEAVRRALEDAGYGSGDFDRENTSVILGAGGGIGELGGQYATRSEIPRFVDAPSERVWERLPEWTQETFPGLISNVIAGRVANRFDFGGSNFTIDAACASSLAAIDLAVKELESGRSNLAIAGGVDTAQSPFAYLCFSKTQALSPRGEVRTFDKTADGIVISEGLAIVVLKRLTDAERDGDRIYGVIKAVAGSSDGKGLGLTAPLPAGQMRAFKRAYKKAGISPNTLGVYEAHGTGTVAGDKAELETIVRTLEANKSVSKSCLVGSIKTMIGHTKSTAGVAGLIKATLSLHHKVLPPHMGVDTPLDAIADPESSVYLLKEAQPWFAHPDYPRRAGVSAFGFGGTNSHAVLEEYRGEVQDDRAPGASAWPYELFLLRAKTLEALAKDVRNLREALHTGAEPRLRDLAYSLATQAIGKSNQSVCLSIVVESLQQLRVALDLVLAHLHGQNQAPLPPHIQLAGETSKENHRIAFLFPGQGAQYPDMAREVALYFKEMRSAVEFASGHLRHLPKLLSQFIYPPSAYSKANEASNQQQLTDTHIAQPAIGAVEAGYMDLVARLGLKPDLVGGHSYGEYAALHAAGVISREEFLRLSETRGRVMSNACAAADGAMAAVQATREELLACLKDFGGVVIANHNAPLQSVISGNFQAVRQVVDSLNSLTIMARMLPVAGAFHSSLVASAQVSLATAIAAAKMHSPSIPVYANTTARPYDSEIDAIRTQLSNHLLSSVEFVAQINAMYEDGARIFVEVGPKSILTKLVGQILQEKNHTAVSLDGQGGGLRGLLLALGTLVTRGVDIKLTALFEGRDVRQLDLSRLAEVTRKPELSPTGWLVNGGGVRPHTEDVSYSGKIPPLDRETAANASKVRTAADLTTIPDRPAPASTESTAPSQLPAPTPAMTFQPTEPQALSNSRASASNGSFSQSHSLDGRHNDNGAASRDAALVAYQAYQETMRQFLALQEQVMMQFLSGSQRGQIVPPPPAITPAPSTVASQLSSNGRHSGNGAVMPSVQAPTPPVVNIPKPVAARQAIATPPVELVPQVASGNHSALSDRASLTQTLLHLVSDRTGYPTEMLGLDQDMEAELGIDSIKRVEIFGALLKSLPETLTASIQERIESFTQVKTLNGIVEELLQCLPTAVQTNAPSTVASPAHSAPPDSRRRDAYATPDPLPDRASLTQTLLHLVSDRTGYPAEMLGLDQDMEAELGIDSIKRVEIFGALLKSLPETLTASIQERIESFTQVKTLNGIVEELLQCLPTAVPTSAPSTVAPEIASPAAPNPLKGAPSSPPSSASSAQEQSGLGKSPSGVETIPRYVMQARIEPLHEGGLVFGQAQGTGQAQGAAPTGLFLITEDQLTVAPYVSEALQQRGARTAIISSSKLLEPEQMAKEIAKLRQDYGPVTGIVHLAPLSAAPIFENLSEWRKYAQIQSKSLFQMLRLCAADLQQAGLQDFGQQQVGRVLAASLLGGCFGRDRHCGPGLPTGGSCNGLLKAMAVEWPNVRAKAIDFDDSLSPADMAQQTIKELLCFGGRLEVGYVQGNRTVFDTVKAPLKTGPAQLEPNADWVVLITGGARGITAEIANELVIPGMTMIVVGRLPEPKEESPEFDGIEDISVLRRVLLDRARVQGLLPTPVQIEVKLKELLRNRTIRRNLESLKQAGARVEYCSVDVKYVMEFGSLIDGIYSRYGRLDAVIHGAGIIEDKLIVDKSAASFDRVFDTKVDSTFILSRYLRPDSLKLLVLFSSVAGRYGNRGQSDYAAANEVINRLAWQMDERWPNTRVVAINWGPWDTTGMASEEVKRQLKNRGIIPINPRGGRQFFVDELRYGRKGETEVIAGEGLWGVYESEHDQLKSNSLAESKSKLNFVFSSSQPQLQPNSTVTLEDIFSLSSEPYLYEHRIDGKSVLPAAGAGEWMAEFVQLAWPEWTAIEVCNLRVLQELVLETEAGKKVLFSARASSHADAESLQVAAEILDPDSKNAFYRASIILRPKLSQSLTLQHSL